MRRKFAGTWTAIITPFKNDGSLDETAFRALVKRQVEGGITGVVPVGTTGESPTLHDDEMKKLFEIAVEECGDRAIVMAGTGSNSTEKTIKQTQTAKAAGAHACLVVTPYYNKPTPEGIKRHFTAVADIGLPVIVYNIKGRTGVNIDTDTMMILAQHKNIVGVKEASGDIEQIKDIIARRPENFAVLSGDDGLTLEVIRAGGDGVISVASNIVPDKITEMVDYALAGNFAGAEKLNNHFVPFFKNIFMETNPMPVKYIAYKMGLCGLNYRLPMCEPSEKARAILDETISKYNL